MKINVLILSLVASLAVVSTANAQGGGRGGRGGGFGGGFGGGGGGIVSLAGNEAVQKDIGLGSDEAAKVKAVADDMRAESREAMQSAGGGNFQDMSREERDKMRDKMTELNKTLTEKYLPKVKAILTADQFTRLQQIHWQAMGTAAYSEAEIIKALPIAKDQQDKISALSSEYSAKTRELFAAGRDGGGFEKMQELNKERDAKINEVLTKDQLDKFAMLKGKEFDVEQLRGGRGGRGGGGGGGGGGGKGKRPQPKAE